MGLSEPDSGEARIPGGRDRDLPNPGRRVGILLDASAQHAGRPGREALDISARAMGVPALRVEMLLELSGSTRRQPANGLDPDGMRWMRGLLRGFADRGGTVLLVGVKPAAFPAAGRRHPARHLRMVLAHSAPEGTRRQSG